MKLKIISKDKSISSIVKGRINLSSFCEYYNENGREGRETKTSFDEFKKERILVTFYNSQTSFKFVGRHV